MNGLDGPQYFRLCNIRTHSIYEYILTHTCILQTPTHTNKQGNTNMHVTNTDTETHRQAQKMQMDNCIVTFHWAVSFTNNPSQHIFVIRQKTQRVYIFTTPNTRHLKSLYHQLIPNFVSFSVTFSTSVSSLCILVRTSIKIKWQL